jgi:small redox-active disulfide protein 2
MDIKVLGSGCAKCNQLEGVTKQAVEKLGLDVQIEHVTDFAQIMSYGVMSTPALVVDGEVRVAGRVPSVDDVAKMLQRG